MTDRTSLTPAQVQELLVTCISSSSFRWRDQFYEQTSGAAMGSPLSPVLADLFMEEFKLDTIENADLRPNLWLRMLMTPSWFGPMARQHFTSSLNTSTLSIHSSSSPWSKNKTRPSVSSMSKSPEEKMGPLLTLYIANPHTQTDIYTARHSTIHASSLPSKTLWSAVRSTPATKTAQVCRPKHLGLPSKTLWSVRCSTPATKTA